MATQKQKTVTQLQKELKTYQQKAEKHEKAAYFNKVMAKTANEVVADIKREISRKKKA